MTQQHDSNAAEGPNPEASSSLSHAGGKTPNSHHETSLANLTRRFTEMLRCTPGAKVNLNLVAVQLKTSKRRIYDVTHVLEGIRLIRKKSKNTIEWLGPQECIEFDRALIEKEKSLDTQIQICTKQIHRMFEDPDIHRFVYLTYEDVQKISSLKDQTVIVIRAPAGTKLEVPHPDVSLRVHLKSSEGPIEVFICSDDPLGSRDTEASLAKSSHLNSSFDGQD